MTTPTEIDGRALILAPHGRDAAIAAALLRQSETESIICSDLTHLSALLGDDIGCAVLTQEALCDADLGAATAWVARQPPWSDLPFIVLTQRGGLSDRIADAQSLSEALRNVIFLERPFHPMTFVSVVQNARRGRYRQYEARSRMEELHESEARLRRLNETLEAKVAERTAQLERAHEAVLEEMRQRERTEEALRQVQKMEMIGQLTGGVAHDFNNLLMAVMGNLELLRKQASNERIVRLIDGALRGAQRGASLTQRLLAFTRQQDLRIEPTHLSHLVRGMIDLLERSVGASIELKFALPEDLPLTLVDANQIELAVLNLVVNARDAMPDGGAVSIAVDAVHSSKCADLEAGDYVRLTVSDTGHGMDPKTLSRATEPFFTTKEVGKGTGLGLSMIHGLALQLNGALRLSSAAGRGTQAELWLPVTSQALSVPATAEPESPVIEPAVAARATILLVDDDALISTSTAYLLEDMGHEVIEVNSGADALSVLEQGRNVDLLITDYAMPKMTGAQLARAARELRPGLPILIATGYADLPQAMSMDIPRLRKPYQQKQLVAEIAKALGGARSSAVDERQQSPSGSGYR
ncbi:phospho-acceptor domain-containing protein [Trinickia symbiotica]|uniref:histidine kinase n=1 Tax=Trinickia symbiotica TaxID=863227 RepID=A0A2N7X4R9_9BURK|nr:hybrid sensor histidine kinase/response regulator [Trinickia symbiotica]PPK46023.1 phospho-acceptor domain-containing protein [Trinickia symbiotica]